MAPSFGPVRLIPRRSPTFITGLAISVLALGSAMALRGVLLGWPQATGLSVTTFPALILTTLYAGGRWGWATFAVSLAAAFMTPIATTADETSVMAMFAVSGALTVAVSATLRASLVRLDGAYAAQAQVQRELAVTEDRFRSLADSAPILMWVTRPDGRREFANRAYVEFLGVPYEAAINFDWRQRLHPDDMDRVLHEQVAGETSRQLFSLEARYRRHDGDYRWVRSVSQPRWGPDGGFNGFIGVGYDVTDARRGEEDLKRINDLLSERVAAALAERDEAEAALQRAQKLEAVGQLTGGVAHDFNNLLTVVIGALDLMQRHPNDEARRERMIDAALGAARRGERLTQQLLAFARRQALKPQPMEVDALLRDTEQLLTRAVGEAVSFSIQTGAASAVVNLDPSQFEAALLNLVVNARDATPAGGLIRLETRLMRVVDHSIPELEPGDYLRVAVLDTGSGMDAATMARVFEPFFTTKPAGRGTGLGLSQVYGFARQSGGTATVDSAPGRGSTLSLYLPVLPGEAVLAQAGPTEAEALQRRPALNVLLAEDDAQVAELVEAMLRDLGHEVRVTENADAALAVLHAGLPVDLLLTDLIMPGEKSGLDLAQAAVALRPDLPVILSSGYTGDVLAPARDAPWPLLRKPYGPDQLARVLAEVLPAA